MQIKLIVVVVYIRILFFGPRLMYSIFLPILAGADPGFFLGGGALVYCSTSTPIDHIVFFFAEYQLY